MMAHFTTTLTVEEAQMIVATLKFVYGDSGHAKSIVEKLEPLISDERNIEGIKDAGHSILYSGTDHAPMSYWCTHKNCDTWSVGSRYTLRGAYEAHLAWLVDNEMWELL